MASATDDPRAKRLMSAGPWQAQMHAQGALLVWKATDGAPIAQQRFGTPRETSDGMLFLPPKELPPFESMLADRFRNDDDCLSVRVVREEQVTVVRILPAYMSPRQILENNSSGDFSTRYGKAVRKALDKLTVVPQPAFIAYRDDLFEAVRLAIMHTHPRATRELIAEYGIMDEDSVWDMWRGTLHVPKEVSAPVVGASASP